MRTFLLVAALAGAVASCGSQRLPPADGAAPEVVARAYLDALVAGDCTATRALLATDVDPAMGDLCGIGHVDAYGALAGPWGTGANAEFGVALTLREMPRLAGWPDGDADVFLHLVREPGGPWRISGVSSGP